MNGKIIVIEGTDCSGKETQSKLLIEKLNKEKQETEYFGFPNYDSPTGKIIGLPYLGKEYIARDLVFSKMAKVMGRLKKQYKNVDPNMMKATFEILSEELAKGWFPEGAPNVDGKISSLYYMIDRAYNMQHINDVISSGKNIILDRYVYSNMAHQGCKFLTEEERMAMYQWCYDMEFNMIGLPQPDVKIFLHMPNDFADFLRKGRAEKLDENEKDTEYLKRAEQAYLEVAKLYGFDTIECFKSNEVCFENIKKPEEINEELYDDVKKVLIKR